MGSGCRVQAPVSGGSIGGRIFFSETVGGVTESRDACLQATPVPPFFIEVDFGNLSFPVLMI
jgi:hypothetical protein